MMGKAEKIGIGVGIVIGFFVLVGIVGSSYDSPAGSVIREETIDVDQITGINKFTIYRDGSMYIMYFRLVNEDLVPVKAPATVSLKLFKEKGLLTTTFEEKYADTFQITPSDFSDWKFGVEETYKPTYLKQILIDPIGGTYGGKATLEVTLSNGKVFTAEETFVD